jgi:hypothetical protein
LLIHEKARTDWLSVRENLPRTGEEAVAFVAAAGA